MPEPYYSFNRYLRERFGQRVPKIAIDAGFPCPNKDGTISTQGCIFCDTYGSGPITNMDKSLSIREQIQQAVAGREKQKFIAYYQAHSNTCAPVSVLRQRYNIIFQFKEVVGLFIGTRPDTINDDVYPLLEELHKKTYLTVELGLQSIHSKSLDFLTRNHNYHQFLETFHKLKERGIDVLVHLIVGIPGETEAEMLQSVHQMNRLKPAGVKFHMLHILKNTGLYNLYREKPFSLLKEDEYIRLIITLLEHLDPGIVVHRLTGDRDQRIFHAPLWAQQKNAVINRIRMRMLELNTRQGAKLNHTS